MTIEPDVLRDAIALVLGRKADRALIADLALVLEAREEVLPWLILRQEAFADDPDIATRLRALAAAGNRPSQQRPQAAVVWRETSALNRELEATLGAMIAANIAGTSRADTVGALLHEANRRLVGRSPGGRSGHDFRRHITEPRAAPVAEPDTAINQFAQSQPAKPSP